MAKGTKTNIRMVASAAGVSPATVSRVFNNNPAVDPELVEKVRKAAKELNYTFISANRDENSNKIVFICPDLGTTYYSVIANGVIDEAKKRGYKVIVMRSDGDPDQELECLRDACGLKAAGIIFTPVSGRPPLELVPDLDKIPMVVTGPRHTYDHIPHVHQDNEVAAYLATRYLLRLGHRNIGFIANFWMEHISSYEEFIKEYHSNVHGYFSAYDRFGGYCRALSEFGLSPVGEHVDFGSFSYESGYKCAQRMLIRSAPLDAIIAPNDRCGAGVLKFLNEQGFKVPEKISLVCLNGGLISDIVTPTLTVVETNNYDMGCRAVEQLERAMAGEEAQDVKISVNLIIKSSTQARSV